MVVMSLVTTLMTAPLFYFLYERPLKKKKSPPVLSKEVREIIVETARTTEDIPVEHPPAVGKQKQISILSGWRKKWKQKKPPNK
jgi:hypothetical protein